MSTVGRTLVIAAAAAAVGFLLASVSAAAYAKLGAWRDYGDKFQLGYIVGYLDAAALSKRQDPRLWIPTMRTPRYERWRALVNEYFADPAHADRSVPDAIGAVGAKLQQEQLEVWREQRRRSWAATPVPTPAGAPPQ